jgi:hypothetical protein
LHLLGQPNTFLAEGDATASGTPTATVTAPRGSGNPDIAVIMDGDVPVVGDQSPTRQYDTYTGEVVNPQSVGYTFNGPVMVTKLTFTEGMHFNNGGWFTDEPVVEFDSGNGVWTRAPGLRCSPPYLDASRDFADGASSFETFVFTFDAVATTGIRLTGTAGGEAAFISVAELRVMGASGAEC